MIRKKIIIIIIFYILLINLYSQSILSINNYNYSNGEINNNILFVDDDNIFGPWQGTIEFPYCKIQDAINNASIDDTIKVFSGTYYENLIINKNLSLCGINYYDTFIDGQFNNYTIKVINCTISIRNFTIRNSGGYKDDCGILLDSNNCIIRDCVIYNTRNGIIINQSFNNINNCSFRKNGIAISNIYSYNNVIENCSFDHNSIGINCDNSINDFIKFCYLYANGIACFFNNSIDGELSHCNVSDNSVNIGGIFIVSSVNITVKDSNIIHNGVGIGLSSSNSINITNCNINRNTHYAISMRVSSKNILISNCIIKNNKRFGIYIEENNQCILMNNNIFNNMLYDLLSKFSYCNAQFNWWGTNFGPFSLKIVINNKINMRGGWIRFIPWSFHEIQNIGSTWNYNENNMISKIFKIQNYFIEFIENDTDVDGIPDWWEEKWGYNPLVWNDHQNLDPDGDSLNNFQECYMDEMESNPFQKDIYLEIDWMKTSNGDMPNKPSQDLIKDLTNTFNNKNIKLHIDLGDLGGGEELEDICTPFLSFPKLTDIYFDHFLNNDLMNPRKGIFHYGIICNKCPDLNFPFYGWDNFDSFAVSAQWLKDENPLKNKSELIIGAIIHHLGHSLKLHADIFEGIDNIGTINPLSSQWWIYNNYISCMNYRYKYNIFTFSDGQNGEGDFNDWLNIDFSFFKNSSF